MAIAIMQGDVMAVGASEYEGKNYPYFEILQRTAEHAEIVRISGNGYKMGDKFNGAVSIKVFGNKLKISVLGGGEKK